VVVVGLAADVCVKDTALDALARGFDTIVLKDLTRGVDLAAGDTERAFEALAGAGATLE
jgi:nicotinamidase/pyrazinamidase